ncbi:ATP-binding protein [Adhaeretor mobilis]|uniref:YhaN AAA domain-containing protein n=1 Tax=Adhaeretor mobilis TaxID=1930276 RepID=A0A517MVN2_9BACT|nr:AAA family ATPase [Adhaeretor mobilis]QDS98929.1 hypothetical protein HG15A2_22170 [Adhaeretor mobilis]
MKITDLEIDGFGVWHDLKLNNLSQRVTAFYGANEAGKTTVMHFVRSVLYGVSSKRRARYLPPIDGGRAGGTLGITDTDDVFRASRYADRGDEDVGRVICKTPDGTEGGDRLLRESLADIDEKTYNNVFAIGLREIQELGTLSDTHAAQWLYRLTSGLDRVSLYDVIQELRQTRRSLLSANKSKNPSKIIKLTTKRDKLRSEIDRLTQQNRQWSQMAVKVSELDGQIDAATDKVRDCERRARTIEIAVGLKENWRRREKYNDQLAAFSGRVNLADDALDRLDALTSKTEQHQRQADILQGQRHQLRDESERLGINEAIVRNCCRIDALGEQRDWLESLGRQIDDLEKQAEQYEGRVKNEQQRLSDTLGMSRGSSLREISEEDLESLQPQIESIRVIQKKYEAAQRHMENLTANEQSLRTQIESAIVGGEQHGLPMDLQEASDLVAKLRKRLQVEQRLEQARQHEQELEHQGQELLDDQVLPLATFNWLLASFVIGALFISIRVLVPESPFGKFGGLLALLGVAGGFFSWVFKFFTEEAAADKLDQCQRQMEVLTRQIADTEAEKEQLDAELPLTDGSVVLRMQAAERHLEELESVLPVEAQRKVAGNEAAEAETRVRQTKRELDGVLANWKSTVTAMGLPESLDPQQLMKVTDRYSQLSELESRARYRREDAAARAREHASLLRRIDEISEEVGLEVLSEDVDSLSRLDSLMGARRKQLAAVEQREQLRERAKELKAEEGKHRRTIVGLKRRKTALFQSADCADEQEFRRLAAEQEKAAELKRKRDAISREITAAIGRHDTEDSFATMLAPDSIGRLDQSWEEMTAELDTLQEELTELSEQRGALKREQDELAKDQSLAECQLDLSLVEHKLAAARQSWREHAAVNRILERIRAQYETEHQPETLAEASKYMSELTGGQYNRIWTPLANDILLVETNEGESLPVDVLSRGTREQLFLSVRMALVANFARRGVNLPMVLDDVLVNFDAIRAKRAAEVLCEFAAGGHQLLIFTCHEHMWEMFKSLDADCRRLPTRRGQPEVIAPVIEEVEVIEAPKPKRKKRRKPKTEPVVEEVVVEVEEPVYEEAEAEEPDNLYEYPFVERLVEERVEVTREDYETEVLPRTSEFHEYTFDIEPVEEPREQDNALAYIINDERSSDRRYRQA